MKKSSIIDNAKRKLYLELYKKSDKHELTDDELEIFYLLSKDDAIQNALT